jgi:hypothetical protein
VKDPMHKKGWRWSLRQDCEGLFEESPPSGMVIGKSQVSEIKYRTYYRIEELSAVKLALRAK